MFGVWALSIWVSLTPIAFAAQIPPSEKLSVDDNKSFAQELDRVRDLLGSANDKGSVQFQIARTYAAGGQYRDVDGEALIRSNDRRELFSELCGTVSVEDVVAAAYELSASRRASVPVAYDFDVRNVLGTSTLS